MFELNIKSQIIVKITLQNLNQTLGVRIDKFRTFVGFKFRPIVDVISYPSIIIRNGTWHGPLDPIKVTESVYTTENIRYNDKGETFIEDYLFRHTFCFRSTKNNSGFLKPYFPFTSRKISI